MEQPWKEYTAADGRKYWHETATNATTWTKPAALMSALELALVSQPWKEYTSENGRKYWHNPKTQQSVWEMPVEYKNALSQAKPSAKPPNLHNFVAGGTPTISNFGPSRERDNYHNSNFQDRHSGYAHNDNARPVFTQAHSENDISNSEEAEAAFMKLLRRYGVQTDWSWDQAMRATIKDPQYRTIKDPKDRKAAFERYLVETRHQEKDKERERLAKVRADFMTMLHSHPEIKHYTRWKTAKPMLEGEAIFKAAKDESERRQMFVDYIAESKLAHSEREVATRRAALEDLVATVKSLNLEPYTRWSEAQIMVEERSMANPNFQSITKIDILKAFEEQVKSLERRFNDVRQRQRSLRSREERQNRDEFISLLREIRGKGLIKANTKWMQVHPLIEKDQRYLAILGQPGSTPLDLFWDMVEEEERSLRVKRAEVLNILEDHRFEVSHQSTKEEFLSVIQRDVRSAKIDSDSLLIIYERLLERALRRSAEDKHYTEKQQRRTVDALRSRIKHLDPAVQVGDSWERVRTRIEKLDEYHALESDEIRRSAYEKHIRRLREKEEDSERERYRREQRERDREHRNGHTKDKRQKSRSPEANAYEADRKRAQADRERQHRRSGGGGLSPSHRHEKDERERYDRRPSKQSSVSHYDFDRRERELDRSRVYISRADPREKTSELDYGDSRAGSMRRRRDSDGESLGSNKRDNKRSRKDGTSRERSVSPGKSSKSPVAADATKEEPSALRSGSEEGEIEED